MKNTPICLAILTVGIITGCLPWLGRMADLGLAHLRYRHIAILLGIVILMVVTMVLAIRADKKQ